MILVLGFLVVVFFCAILFVSKALSFCFNQPSKLWSVYCLEITVPVGWAFNTNN